MKTIACVLLVLVSCCVFAQQQEDTISKKHRLTLVMANSHVPKVINEKTTFFIVPTWGFDYDYCFNEHWALGIKNDIKLADFEIEPENEEVIERTYPICSSLMVTRKIWKELAIFAGPGYEFSYKSKNFFQLMLGTEYGFKLKEDLELSINFTYENKQNYYSAWMLGFGLSKYL